MKPFLTLPTLLWLMSSLKTNAARRKTRRAVKLMNRTLTSLGISAHPGKAFIGKTSKGFGFLGVQYPDRISSQLANLTRMGTLWFKKSFIDDPQIAPNL